VPDDPEDLARLLLARFDALLPGAELTPLERARLEELLRPQRGSFVAGVWRHALAALGLPVRRAPVGFPLARGSVRSGLRRPGLAGQLRRVHPPASRSPGGLAAGT